ncbi:MAG: hypothetical protein JXR59_11295 [Desulfuromonadaceae bacterium]|nr:hypothetical protein [Desulfuromonadaceae bacterium]
MTHFIVRKKVVLMALLLTLAGAAVVVGWGSYRHFAPVTADESWQFRVFKDGIERVSALAADGDTALFVTQEFYNGKGRLLRLDPDGRTSCVLEQLSKPDGLTQFHNALVISQEGGQQPLLLMENTQVSPLFWAKNIEGIASDNHFIYAVEDLPRGRLLQFDPGHNQLRVLRSGLHEAEGVCVAGDGRIFYAEKESGTIKQWNPDGVDRILMSGLNQPGYLCWSDEGLWITEDATHGARLLLLSDNGRLQVVLDHLRSAQTLLPLHNGHFLLAEQGRNRILEIFSTALKSLKKDQS